MVEIVKGNFPRKAETEEKLMKKTTAVLGEEIARAMTHEVESFVVPWSIHYRVIEPSPGARLIIEEIEGQVLVERPIEYLANQLIGWMTEQRVPEWFLTFRKAKEVAEIWRALCAVTHMREIKSIRWADEQGLTWQRLPWSRQNGVAPTWEKLLSRMSNAGAFVAWIGSLFYEESSLHNYVWLHGNGGDGKGAINRFLQRVFGRAYRSKQPPGQENRFWAYDLLGARLVVFPDCQDGGFVSRGLFKSLTGGDPICLEAKGQMSFTASLSAKYLILSNEKPLISSEIADMRRIIYCELEAGEYDPEFEDKLWKEGGIFLAECIEAYQVLCPRHEPIKGETDQIREWVSTVEEPFEVVFAKYFKLVPEGRVLPADMQKILREEWPHKRMPQLEFLHWLRRTHKVQKVQIREKASDDRPRFYLGISKISAPITDNYIDYGS